MLTIKQAWIVDRSAAAGPPTLASVELIDHATQAVLYVDHSTLATTNSFVLQSAQQSTGPWVSDGTVATAAAATISAAAGSTNLSIRVVGPIGPWVRPVINTASSGGYDFLLIAVAP